MIRATDLRCLCAAAGLFFGLAVAASASPTTGTGFEDDPIGTTNPNFKPADPDFGFFSGGTVEAPGSTIDAIFQLAGNNVYFGNELTYTNIFPNGYHCCGYFRMEMRISTLGPVRIDIFGHGTTWPDDPFDEDLMHSEVVNGLGLFFGWGIPWEPIEGEISESPDQSDITTIRWTSLDGQSFAIDNVLGIGIPVIPEPATWAMMIMGFGLIGASLRRRARLLA
jgi:hypothetical protein